MTMADTVAVMNHGRIEQLGRPSELYDHPRTAFVANFLGQSNLVPGTVVERLDGMLGVDVGGARVHVPTARSAVPGQQALVGVRPEKVRLVAPGAPAHADENLLGPGTVVDASFTGVSTQYRVDVPGVGTFEVFAQNAGAAPPHAPGTQVGLAWPAAFTFALDGHEEPAAGTVDLDGEP